MAQTSTPVSMARVFLQYCRIEFQAFFTFLRSLFPLGVSEQASTTPSAPACPAEKNTLTLRIVTTAHSPDEIKSIITVNYFLHIVYNVKKSDIQSLLTTYPQRCNITTACAKQARTPLLITPWQTSSIIRSAQPT